MQTRKHSSILLFLLVTCPLLACLVPEPEKASDDVNKAPNEDALLRIPLLVSAYDDGGGKLLRLSIALDDGAPFDVLVDTGSDGLRVFGNLLRPEMRPTQLETLETQAKVYFGASAEMSGPLARSLLHLGGVWEGKSAVTVHWIEEMGCSDSFAPCELADGTAPFFTDIGIYGILGLSSRRGMLPELFSPFAQLPEPYSDGHLIHVDNTGGDSFIALGDPVAWLGEGPDVTVVALTSDATHPNGHLAWSDDTIRGCFFVNGDALDPPCTELVLDSGSSADVIYSNIQQADYISDGVLAPGIEFRAEIGEQFSYGFSVGDFPAPSEDLVFVDSFEPFAILGIRLFLENDVGIRLQAGQLLLRSHAIVRGSTPRNGM